MKVIEMLDPNFVATSGFSMRHSKGEVLVTEGEPMTLSFNKEGNLVYGTGGMIVKIVHETALADVLSRVKPATFSLKVEEDSEFNLVASLKENVDSLAEVMKSVPRLDHPYNEAVEIQSIRTLEI